ncbi:MAG: helix-turn-helix domain-containing protein [Lachnospiraceae bacterium]|nr:helix-turn-helix domain-containing protein [Lachnospiraceae bacterium]
MQSVGIIICWLTLEPVIRKYPQAEAYLYRTATERFADVLWVMQQILFLSVDRRIGQFLWDEITRSCSLVIAMTHDEIARYMGSAREVVTKGLKYFQSEGVLTLSRGKITVVNKEKLKKYI